MSTFYSLYNRLLQSAVNNNLDEQLEENKIKNFDNYHLDCLLHPQKHPLIIRTDACRCSDDEKKSCSKICIFNALKYDSDGNAMISENLCSGCSACIDNCKYNVLVPNSNVLPVIDLLIKMKEPVYAMVAPAFIKQFNPLMTQGRLRNVLKKLGFAGMIEVALFADMLTLKESLEFERSIKTQDDFMLTSCCCPIWIAMIKKLYTTMIPHLPPSVSPMIACGRAVKKLYPNAKTVFIGPCIAKKAEAKEPDIADAVDYVLTFQEIKDIFDAAKIVTEDFDEDERDHSSMGGRLYARAGGVSQAVQDAVNRLNPNRPIPLNAKCANGIQECKVMLKQLMEGNVSGNFMEGMGCVGGCVGGPKAILPKEEGALLVDEYAKEASCITPTDNPYVIELLHRIGFDTIDSLLEDNDIFIRKF